MCAIELKTAASLKYCRDNIAVVTTNLHVRIIWESDEYALLRHKGIYNINYDISNICPRDVLHCIIISIALGFLNMQRLLINNDIVNGINHCIHFHPFPENDTLFTKLWYSEGILRRGLYISRTQSDVSHQPTRGTHVHASH